MKFKNLTSKEILIHVFSFLILFLAGYYYLERTLPFDGAFYSFRMSETGWFCIDNYRYGVQHTQVIPLLLLKIGCSLKTFLISYSVSFALCNYILCLTILYVYKNPKIALGLLIATLLSYTFKFFYPVSEIHSTIAPLFLFAAHVFHFENRKNNYLYFLLTALFITWFLFIHIISFIPALYILAYYVVYSKSFKKNLPIILFSSLLLVIEFMLSKTFLTTEYLASKMIGVNEVMQFLSNPIAAPGFNYFKDEFFFNYLPLEILYLGCIIFLLIKKEYLQTITLISFTAGTWIIIMTYNLNKDAPIVYMNYYGLFGFYIAFPFCLCVINYVSSKVFVSIYTLLIISSLVGIIRSGALMSDQVNYYERVTTNMKTSKGIVRPANLDWQSLWVSWDLSFQSLLVSSLNNPQQSKTFFSTEDTSRIKEYTSSSTDKNCFFNSFFSPYWFSAPFGNKKYYNLPPSNYTYLNTLQDSLFKDSLLSNKNIDILAPTETIYLLKNNFRTIPVTIVNRNPFLIPSTPSGFKSVSLSYHVFTSKKEMLPKNGKRSSLEMDVQPNDFLTTGVSIDCTQLHRGRVYYIDIDMVIENNRWLGINKRIKIILI
ncbi:MAG: hypothetical protein ACYDCN_02940 [Bacteroidia bacterium]